MSCYITRTGSFLPGSPVENDQIETYLGKMMGESKIKKKILAANKITQRHYAQNEKQEATHDVYDLAVEAIRDCIGSDYSGNEIGYLSAGTTHTPYNGPGLASILHGKLSEQMLVNNTLEINSNSGICSSAAQSFVNAHRAIEIGGHKDALAVGSEHPSEILKSKVLRPHYDFIQMYREIKESKWFMSVFLRFMLSDGAGAFLLSSTPDSTGTNFEVNWTFSQSFAHEAPLCMKLENKTLLLSQDIRILAKHLGPSVGKFISNAMTAKGENLDDYDCLLPHISSYFFIRTLKNVLREQLESSDKEPEYWTNLASKGNTGAASIYIMLDEFAKTRSLSAGTKLLLFVPESGQFNFVLISLTVV